jgi:hypothetical protein
LSHLKYVCLSDLHLGADYSVLSFMNDDGSLDPGKPSATLTALGTALRQYVKSLSGSEPPQLILLGDTLDLGQSPFGVVSQGFNRFIEAMFPADEPTVFSHHLLTLPGNHDHHLWRAAQDRYFLDQLRLFRGASQIPNLIELTPLFEPGGFVCDIMAELLHGYPHLQDASVQLAYPNLGLLDETRSRCVVLHHGHFVDSLYRLMSTIGATYHGGDLRPKTMKVLEQQNGAWIDFLFSDLGSSGAVGTDVVNLYDTMRGAAASHQFAQVVSAKLLEWMANTMGVGPHTVVTHGMTVSNLVKALLDVTFVRNAEVERDCCDAVMSAGGVSDLRWFLDGPVRRQIEEGGKLDKVRDLSFVFGHTHKPFADELAIKSFARPVAVYNTGGWVMDQPTKLPTQGAAGVFIDDEMNLASLRFFNDPVDGQFAPVRALGVGGFRDQDNPLLAQMTEALQASAASWASFSAQTLAAVELHSHLLLQKFFALDTQS